MLDYTPSEPVFRLKVQQEKCVWGCLLRSLLHLKQSNSEILSEAECHPKHLKTFLQDVIHGAETSPLFLNHDRFFFRRHRKHNVLYLRKCTSSRLCVCSAMVIAAAWKVVFCKCRWHLLTVISVKQHNSFKLVGLNLFKNALCF